MIKFAMATLVALLATVLTLGTTTMLAAAPYVPVENITIYWIVATLITLLTVGSWGFVALLLFGWKTNKTES